MKIKQQVRFLVTAEIQYETPEDRRAAIAAAKECLLDLSEGSFAYEYRATKAVLLTPEKK